jgi:arabinose-5-phosphate isomerase
LASTGTPAFFVHPSEASHGDLGMIANNDVILALSWSGETAELKSITDYSRRYGIKLIAMTAIADSALAKMSDVALVLPQAREACPHNLAPTTSSLMQLALGDALAIALLESHGFTAVAFGLLHPGGKLGTLLKTVRDIMHTGATMPLMPLGTRMSDAILEMTTKGFGCVGILDGRGLLTGIITDGDLRRHMRNDLLNAHVDDVMTRSPKSVRPDQLLSETLDILNSMKVTALFAVEAGKPVGIIHVHDLLRTGRGIISPSADDFCNRLDHGIDRWRRSVTAKYGDGSAADRPREAWPTAGKDRDQRNAQGCSKVQQSCIHADYKLRTGDQCRDLVERLALLDVARRESQRQCARCARAPNRCPKAIAARYSGRAFSRE